MRICKLLDQSRMTLLVSLPRNDVELARAAVDAGADALKVHINVAHRASGTHFGSWPQERDIIERILNVARVPVGLMAGADTFASRAHLEAAQAAGIDFVNSYPHHLPGYALMIPGLAIVAALSSTATATDAASLHALPGVHALEASIMPGEGYGKPLTLADLVALRTVTSMGSKPVVVPAQRAITPHDIPLLQSAGVRGIMLGAVVTGDQPSNLGRAVRMFREAMSW